MLEREKGPRETCFKSFKFAKKGSLYFDQKGG